MDRYVDAIQIEPSIITFQNINPSNEDEGEIKKSTSIEVRNKFTGEIHKIYTFTQITMTREEFETRSKDQNIFLI